MVTPGMFSFSFSFLAFPIREIPNDKQFFAEKEFSSVTVLPEYSGLLYSLINILN